MTLADREAQSPEQWRQEGVAQVSSEGVAQGDQEFAAQGRVLLRRVAAARFGDAAARRVEDLLGATEDLDQLAAAVELIARAESGPDLIDRIARTMAQERALLRRVAAVRFDDAVARRVEDLLRETESWDQLAAAVELIMRAESGPGLIDSIARTIRQSGQGS